MHPVSSVRIGDAGGTQVVRSRGHEPVRRRRVQPGQRRRPRTVGGAGGTLRLVWDEATHRETEHVVGKIPPLAGADLSGLFLPDGRHDRPTDPRAFGFIPDPADRKFAVLAGATGAVLVTNDRHLLDGRPHPGVVALIPDEFTRQAGPNKAGR